MHIVRELGLISKLARPTQSSIFSLYFCALIVYLLRLRASNLNPSPTSTQTSTQTSTSLSFQGLLPLHVRHLSQFSREVFTDLSNHAKPLTPRTLTFWIIIAAIALSFRLELFRIILANRQCTVSGVEVEYYFIHDSDMANEMLGMCAIITRHL